MAFTLKPAVALLTALDRFFEDSTVFQEREFFALVSRIFLITRRQLKLGSCLWMPLCRWVGMPVPVERRCRWGGTAVLCGAGGRACVAQ